MPALGNSIYSDAASTSYVRILMMFPGLWLGSLLAPWFSKCGGPMCDLFFYFVVLVGVGTYVVGMAAVKLGKGKEDINIDVDPMFSVDAINVYFKDGEEEAGERRW